MRDDVQVIVVDDNSDADRVDFEYFPQWKGRNYECYFTKKGGGTGYAENIGMGYAKGKWLLFSGADDYFLPSIGEVFDEEKDTDADMVYFRPTAVMLEDRFTPSKRVDVYKAFFHRYFVSGNEMELRCRSFSICNRLISNKMIRDKGIRFEEIKYSNDNLFAVKVGVNAGKIVVRDKSIYCVTESGNTLTSNFLNKPGELQIRSGAFFRAQMILHANAYPVDEEFALHLLRLLFSEDREAFVLNFNRMRKMGYKKTWLIHELFKQNSKKARIKRGIYCFVMTGI